MLKLPKAGSLVVQPAAGEPLALEMSKMNAPGLVAGRQPGGLLKLASHEGGRAVGRPPRCQLDVVVVEVRVDRELDDSIVVLFCKDA